jgi:hypothetical protein
MKLEFSGQVLEKYPNIKCHEYPSGGSRNVSCGQTHNDESNSRLSQLCKNTPKKKNTVCADHVRLSICDSKSNQSIVFSLTLGTRILQKVFRRSASIVITSSRHSYFTYGLKGISTWSFHFSGQIGCHVIQCRLVSLQILR